MTADYDVELRARFDGVDLGDAAELPDLPWLKQVLLRRTHRRYADRPIAPALMRLLLAAAFSASSKSDFQQATAILVEDRGRRDRLAALIPDMPWIGTAPAFLVFCGDARRLERIGAMRGHRLDNAGLEGFFNAAVDAALAMQTMILAAETAGLGCCPISVLRNHAAAVGGILELPQKVFPVAGLCLGWPAQEGHISLRLPLAATMHTDRYDDAQLAAQIDDYDRRRALRYTIPRAQQRAPERFGYAPFYGWSEDKARQAVDPEGAGFPAWLRARGFRFD
jgi:FMN reductase [NAD(P)H]